MGRCGKCFNGFPVMSENGVHYNCCLNDKDSLNCLIGKEDHYDENPMKAGRTDD